MAFEKIKHYLWIRIIRKKKKQLIGDVGEYIDTLLLLVEDHQK